jgi:hypothetical protein
LRVGRNGALSAGTGARSWRAIIRVSVAWRSQEEEEDGMGEGFESHWDASFFRGKAAQCRELASCIPDAGIRATLEEMASDFDTQGDVAAEAAKSVPKRPGGQEAGL